VRFPSLAGRIASALGLDPSVPAFDLQMACSAYPYALYLASRNSDTGKSVLVIDGDVQSPLVDASDPATAPLFSDASTATLVRCDAGGSGRASRFAFLSRHSSALECSAAGPVKMDGFGVFSFVAAEAAPFLEDFVKEEGGADAFDAFVPHQANMYMAKQLAKSLGLEKKLVCAGAECANPGSCSVPAALAAHGKSGRNLLAGFGAGLSASAAAVRLACAAAALVLHAAFAGGAQAAQTTPPTDVAADPAAAFADPPRSAKTGVWWHWMGRTVTKEGIAKDLDWFKRTGIGTATIFGMADICTPWATEILDNPAPPLVAFTDDWWRLVRFACDEAEKRGIELGIHNCPGYTSTGGPWIPPRLAMRELVFNITNAEKQVSLQAHAPFPVQDPKDRAFRKPDIPARRSDIQDIATVDGICVQHIPMGSFTQPNQHEAFGLECDKMNPEAVAFHLDHVLGDMKKHLGRHVGRTLKFVLLDSYEAGKPTWTPKMREEFAARRGYDPLPFLPVLGGFHVSAAKDAEAEQKFKKDYDLTIKELFRDVLFKTMHEKLSAAGLEFACEPYTGPFDSRECAQYVDRLMTEFWFRPQPAKSTPKLLGWDRWTGPGGVRHNIVEAEAFTAAPGTCNWTETPYLLKIAGDTQFRRGINRMTLHTCPHQPWDDTLKPGKTMGRWGTHFGRNQTWAESGRGWFAYLNRCQALLQWGEPGGKESDIKGRGVKPAGSLVTSLPRRSRDMAVVFVANHSGNSVYMDMEPPASAKGAPEWFDPVSGRVCTLVPAPSGLIPVRLAPFASGFLVYRGGRKAGAPDDLSHYVQNVDKPCRARFYGRDVFTPPASWKIDFAGERRTFETLADWTRSDDPAVKYFSGTARYETVFGFDGDTSKPAILSLGDCSRQIAQATVNGVRFDPVWCEPYEVLLPPDVLRKGENALAIDFTNVWANRLIGDEQEPEDCDFAAAPMPGGRYLRRFPAWFADGIAARASKGRKCFKDWNYFDKNSKPVKSGLLGPVSLAPLRR